MTEFSPVLVRKFLHTFDIQTKKEDELQIVQMLQDHMESVIYNVTAIAMVMALLNDKRKIETKHLGEVRRYIASHCPLHKQKGGFPASYFGTADPNYSSLNGTGSIVSTIQFENGVARPQIGGTMNGFMCTEKKIATYAKHVLKHHNTTISQEALKGILEILDVHVMCLAQDLQGPTPLTLKKLSKVMKLKRHAVFN